MIYFLYGESSYHALRKINDFKNAFKKKAEGFLIEEYDGRSEEISFEKFHASLGQANLFSKTRLVIFKNALSGAEKLFNEIKTGGESLKNSKDVFVFWEGEPEAKILTFFKKYSEKTQEVKETGAADLDKWLDKKAQSLGLKLDKNERTLMAEEAGDPPAGGAEWALEGELEKLALSEPASSKHETPGKKSDFPGKSDFKEGVSPFAFIDKMFGSKALLALKEMSLAGIEPQKFIYAFLWKLKQKSAQGGPASGWADAYFAGIEAESQMRRDPKNSEEILERFIFSLKA
ncbi:MAG: hypothetical protein Q8P07_02515 [bacterium]|nr:hypothetical protein [bacterium]